MAPLQNMHTLEAMWSTLQGLCGSTSPGAEQSGLSSCKNKALDLGMYSLGDELLLSAPSDPERERGCTQIAALPDGSITIGHRRPIRVSLRQIPQQGNDQLSLAPAPLPMAQCSYYQPYHALNLHICNDAVACHL